MGTYRNLFCLLEELLSARDITHVEGTSGGRQGRRGGAGAAGVMLVALVGLLLLQTRLAAVCPLPGMFLFPPTRPARRSLAGRGLACFRLPVAPSLRPPTRARTAPTLIYPARRPAPRTLNSAGVLSFPQALRILTSRWWG